jgi:hypothetical protein
VQRRAKQLAENEVLPPQPRAAVDEPVIAE